MKHVAIMKKGKVKNRDNLLQNILDGTKTIESRWYVNKIAPWDKIQKKDIVYFKESGKLITVKAEVKKVLQFDNLNKKLVNEVIKKYGTKIAPNTSENEWEKWKKNIGKEKILYFVVFKKC